MVSVTTIACVPVSWHTYARNWIGARCCWWHRHTKTIHQNVLRTKYARDNRCLTADVHFLYFGSLVRLARADNATTRYTRFINNKLHIEEVYRRYHGRRRWRSSSQKKITRIMYDKNLPYVRVLPSLASHHRFDSPLFRFSESQKCFPSIENSAQRFFFMRV